MSDAPEGPEQSGPVHARPGDSGPGGHGPGDHRPAETRAGESDPAAEVPVSANGTSSADGRADPLIVAFERLEREWDDEEAHKRFIGLAFSLERLPDAAGRYRVIRDHQSDRSEVASRQIDRIMALAMQSLELHRSPPPKERPRWLNVAAVAVTAALVMASLYYLLNSVPLAP